jgi:hypothetical protein
VMYISVLLSVQYTFLGCVLLYLSLE